MQKPRVQAAGHSQVKGALDEWGPQAASDRIVELAGDLEEEDDADHRAGDWCKVGIDEHLAAQEGHRNAHGKQDQEEDDVAHRLPWASRTLGLLVVVPCRFPVDLVLGRAIELVAHRHVVRATLMRRRHPQELIVAHADGIGVPHALKAGWSSPHEAIAVECEAGEPSVGRGA